MSKTIIQAAKDHPKEKIYSKRGTTVEPVFGQLKDGRRFERLMLRGLKACESEWSLMCTTHNLMKLHRWKAAMAVS